MPVTGDGRFYLPFDDQKLVLALPRTLPDPLLLPGTLRGFLTDEDERRAAAEFIGLMRPLGMWAGIVEELLVWHMLTHGGGGTRWLIKAINRLGQADHIDSRTIGGREFYLPNPRFATLALNRPLPA